MYPYLYQSPSITIGSYGVMLAIAYLTGRYIYINNIQQRVKTPVNTEALIIALLIFGVIGAKILFILKNPEAGSITDWHSLTAGSGFSSQGAIAAAMIVTLIYSQLCKIKLNLLLDTAAPAAVLAYAIARIGCFLAGDDCWGTDSHLPWAMGFPNGIHPTDVGQTVHPLPLYEAIYSLLIWKYLTISLKKDVRPYFTFCKLLVLWGFCRFLIEFISTNPVKILNMSGSQFGALLMFISGVLYFAFYYLVLDKKKPGK